MSKFKKILIFGILFLASVGVALYLIVVIKSARVATFEECWKAGWLVRKVVVYDYTIPTEKDVEKECVLWSGKNFVKQYGNR